MKRYFIITVFPVIWLITAPVFSDEPNPFREGTEKKTLTETEKQSLLQYANTSKTTLERAKREAEGKPLQETLDIYVDAITSVVLKSFNEEKRRELLMRVSLNQALQLTVGIPRPDGKKIEEKGVLTNAPVDLTAAILENAIDLALSYYPKDREAIEAGDLLKLPFFEYAAQRLAQAKSWLTGIHSWQLQLEFEKAILEQWKTSVLSDQNLERERVAPLILDVEEALAKVTLPQHTVSQKVRFLRGVIRQLLEDSARMVPDLEIITSSSTSSTLSYEDAVEDEDAVEAIRVLGKGISTYTNPTLQVAKKIGEIVDKAPSRAVRLEAIRQLSKGISSYTNPTLGVAEVIAAVCGNDEESAISGIKALGYGISTYTNPTIAVAERIVEIFKNAPYKAVRKTAISILQKGLSDNTNPTQQISHLIAACYEIKLLP